MDEMGSKYGYEASREEDEPPKKDDILVAVVRQPLAQHTPAHTKPCANHDF